MIALYIIGTLLLINCTRDVLSPKLQVQNLALGLIFLLVAELWRILLT